jgi:hypothetical protein
MKVTLWTPDFTSTELDNIEQFTLQHCDIVYHHFVDCLPCKKALKAKLNWIAKDKI